MAQTHRRVKAVSLGLACCFVGFLAGSCRSEPAVYGEIEHQVTSSDLPLKWRVAPVDARFGVSREDVVRAVEQGVAIWETAAGRKLFERDDTAGFPIKLVFDERQKELLDVLRSNRAVQTEEDMMSAQRGMTAGAVARFESAAQQLRSRVQSYEMRLNTYNQRINQINASGGIPPGQEFAIEQERQALDSELAAIQQAEQEVERLRIEANQLADEFNRQVKLHNEQVTNRQRTASPAKLVRLGECRIVETKHRGTTKTNVEVISIFAFQGLDHLTFILAHELGHALGLDHVEGDGALMSAVEDGRRTPNKLAATDRDLAALARALESVAGR